jgi:hypothetical protein
MNEPQDIREELANLLKSLEGREVIEQEQESYDDEYIFSLKNACHNLLRKESFQVGQLVKWKPNLQNRKLPYKNQPAIVIEILEKPITSNNQDPGSPYFQEKLDIVLGVLMNDGTFVTFYYESRRFEHF